MAEVTTQRIVPGAPPPVPLTKSQLKKKRKTKKADGTDDAPVTIPDAAAAALVEKAPDAAAVENGTVASELIVQDAPPPPAAPASEPDTNSLKLSPIVDLVTKRLKVTNKKIVRFLPILWLDLLNLVGTRPEYPPMPQLSPKSSTTTKSAR